MENRYFRGIYGEITENDGKKDTSTGIVWDGNGKSGFPRQSFGWEREINSSELFGLDHGNDICTGTGIDPNSAYATYVYIF